MLYNYRPQRVQMYPPPHTPTHLTHFHLTPPHLNLPPPDLTHTPSLEDALQLPATPGADVPATLPPN